MPKRRNIIENEELDAMEVVSFILHVEADKLEQENSDLQASDLSATTVELEHVSLHEMLRALAEWISGVVRRVRG